MSGPFTITEHQDHEGVECCVRRENFVHLVTGVEYCVRRENFVYLVTHDETLATNARDSLNEAYQLGRADADKGLREACKALIDADADSFVDAGTPGNHRTEHVCIGCGSSHEHDELCPVVLARAALAATEPTGARP